MSRTPLLPSEDSAVVGVLDGPWPCTRANVSPRSIVLREDGSAVAMHDGFEITYPSLAYLRKRYGMPTPRPLQWRAGIILGGLALIVLLERMWTW